MATVKLDVAFRFGPLDIVALSLCLAIGTLWYYYHHHRGRSQLPLPPGPEGLPLVGNALQIPGSKQWLAFDRWAKRYGTIYSDRPTAVMAGELVGWSRGLGYTPSARSARFRAFRRLFARFLGLDDLVSAQERENARMLGRLAREPARFLAHFRDSTGALILRLAYGYEAGREDGDGGGGGGGGKRDEMVRIAEEAMDGFARASEPGRYWVDQFPILRYVPEWMPGAGFKADAREMRRALERLYDVPYAFVKEQVRERKALKSFTSTYLEERGGGRGAEGEELIKAAAASLYSGGAETTPSSLAAFVLAMVLFPAVQIRAQREIDALLDADAEPARLPALADRGSLPYVDAIVKEVYRWNPAVPLGLPHRLREEDAYRGWRVPRGTTVWANIWAMLHDERYFPDPEAFRPERYLDAEGWSRRRLEREEDPGEIAFGFGRRICPGLHLADSSVFLGVATMLYAFRMSKARDEETGEEITPVADFDGFISHPKPFKCRIEPRTSAIAALLAQA
ncbi:cytochrome P450 [Punctularia strigosozonata HHB-11173 SS5]|uniref:cytochrome P450 n=1 Tax=Punctularia strigosozonata (strain HHB-11173) TaxID=741275 RepID=UPI0004416536|nr:cytochrome P450 [Punctularia strigosozonata HHB-11173 SS5]EIN09035.1 cytochrome P450 [Punctularia strigosozonata HHB-11173 SS5]